MAKRVVIAGILGGLTKKDRITRRIEVTSASQIDAEVKVAEDRLRFGQQAGRLGNIQTAASSGVVVVLFVSFLQAKESRFSRAMPGSNPLELPFVLQVCGEQINLIFRCRYQMQSAEQNAKARINRRSRLQDFFDSRVRAADH